MIEAAKEVNIKIPVVVRLQGTNAEEGRKLLSESGLKVEVATDLWEAAQKIVAVTGKKRQGGDGLVAGYDGRTSPGARATRTIRMCSLDARNWRNLAVISIV